jgi:hypothetical protein
MTEAIETRRFEKPDQVLDMKARGRISIVKMADGTTALSWRCMRRPIARSDDQTRGVVPL